MVKNSSNYPTPYEIYLFIRQTYLRVMKMLGAHVNEKTKKGVRFSVWAPQQWKSE